jgi:predicted  nucleic acid-binding Zn-ribbon protein
VNERIAEAEKALASGTRREKVDAAGELAFLRRQKATIEDRLKEIEAEPHATETLFEWVKEEAFNLNLRLQSWCANV